jgi:hypothetical protein
MSIEKKLLGTTPAASGDTPEGVSFDGTNDYLSRSSDLSGNADSKTFTFSAWVYGDGYCYIANDGSSYGFRLVFQASINTLQILGNNSAGTRVLNPVIEFDGVISNTWTHILISIDLANTSNRYVYINDKLASVTWSTYIDDSINFTQSKHNIGSYTNGSSPFTGRLAHVFLDYTYRDLSVTANRRLFIDSDGKPSSTIPSSPIIYLPMTDAATAGSNSGTGGDFTVNGVLDTAGRGPNQWNCSASTFDGSADYLSRSSITGIADGKQFVVSFILNSKTASLSLEQIYNFGNGIYGYYSHDDQNFNFQCKDSATTTVAAHLTLNNFNADGRNTHIAFSVDVDGVDTSKRHIYVDGQIWTDVTWNTFADITIAFTNTPCSIATQGYSPPAANDYFEGYIGELYLDTAYIDLSTDNPFWDADANRPKPVRQVISETGTTPLIALPLRGNDAGNNLGSGGDFTVNSGPYTGARGGSEFWARSANFDGALGTGLQNSDSIASDTKTYTYLISFKKDSASGTGALLSLGSASTFYISFWSSLGTDYHFTAYGMQDNYGSAVYQRYSDYNSTSAADTWYTVLGSIDLNNAKDHMYLNGSNQTRATTNFNNAYIESSNITQQTIGARNSVREDGLDGDVVVHYFSTDYTDFSQESNRNLFVDQLGYPKDLTPAIEAGTIADPLIYMKFDDTSALGTNSGTGGNFTVNGTVTAGADVDPNA